MRRLMVALWVCAWLAVGIPAFAQKDNPFAGTWERISATRDGKDMEPPEGAPAGVKLGTWYKICAADGHFMQIRISDGRPTLKTTLAESNKEEIMSQIWGLIANYGTYNVSGDKITYKTIKATSPAGEGAEAIWTAHFEGPEWVENRIVNGTKVESRYRRVK